MRHAFVDGFSSSMRVVTTVAVVFAVITFVRAPEMQQEALAAKAEA